MKKEKTKSILTDEKLFETTVQALNAEKQAFLREQGIKNLEELFQALALVDIDPRKLIRLNDHELQEELNPEDFRFDKDDPARPFFDEDDDEPAAEVSYTANSPKEMFTDEEPCELHVRIKLNDAPVAVWREIVVPSNMTMELFASFILESMGWYDYHLHQFTDKNTLYQSPDSMEEGTDFNLFGRFHSVNAATVSVGSVLTEKGKRIRFEYDFGDGWEHDVWLKGKRAYNEGEEPKVRLLKGCGECPPEDCGGVWGYEDLLGILKKKRKSAEDKERLEWYQIEKDFDPTFFDIEFKKEDIDDLWKDTWETYQDLQILDQSRQMNKNIDIVS